MGWEVGTAALEEHRYPRTHTQGLTSSSSHALCHLRLREINHRPGKRRAQWSDGSTAQDPFITPGTSQPVSLAAAEAAETDARLRYSLDPEGLSPPKLISTLITCPPP